MKTYRKRHLIDWPPHKGYVKLHDEKHRLLNAPSGGRAGFEKRRSLLFRLQAKRFPLEKLSFGVSKERKRGFTEQQIFRRFGPGEKRSSV